MNTKRLSILPSLQKNNILRLLRNDIAPSFKVVEVCSMPNFNPSDKNRQSNHDFNYKNISINNDNYCHYVNIAKQVEQIYRIVFDNAYLPFNRYVEGKKKLLLTYAEDSRKIVGFKLGFEEKEYRFYSCLGGVLPAYRRMGIANKLMHMQHQWCKENGYNIVRTKTMNKWKSMLILNLKNGFDIIGTYLDENYEIKIILDKRLGS